MIYWEEPWSVGLSLLLINPGAPPGIRRPCSASASGEVMRGRRRRFDPRRGSDRAACALLRHL